jgi:hypothetical protein
MDDDTNSKRIIFTNLLKRFVISLRVSTGEDGWLWYIDGEHEWKHSVIVGFHKIEDKLSVGIQLFVGPFNLVIAWGRKGA